MYKFKYKRDKKNSRNVRKLLNFEPPPFLFDYLKFFGSASNLNSNNGILKQHVQTQAIFKL